MSTAVAGKGLEGIVAANSGICWIDGEAGVLAYRGIDIHELAENSTFEETTYLLWNGHLPNQFALARVPVATRRSPARSTSASSTCCAAFPPRPRPWKCCAPRSRRSASTTPTRKTTPTTPTCARAYNLTAQIAMIVAIYDRIRKGK